METHTVEVAGNLSTIGLAERYLLKALKRIDISEGRPPVVALPKVIAHPRYTALYDARGKIIPESRMYVMPFNAPANVKAKFLEAHKKFEPETIDISNVEASEDTVVFGGASHAHFGHHLLDGMARLWYHSTDPTLYLDAHPQRHGVPSFISEYRALGRPRVVYDIQKPTQFANLILPYAAVQNHFRIFTNADTEHLEITRSALKRARQLVSAKIYLSRSGVGKRPCEGEEELEQRLALYGFEIIRPETLSIVDQISIFNRADWIVGLIGSAFHNVMFMRPGASTKTVQFTWKKPNLRYVMIDLIKCQTSYFAGTVDTQPIDRFFAPTRIDVEESISVLREIGALEPRRFFGYRPKHYSPRKGLLGLKDRFVDFRDKAGA